ncbi:hypothetical protein K435DRAFT_641339 [Dendrothele bispora CBS 962.96]|uniref:Urease accessory protein UreF n=1 Tax=Dendrothele bispora (strain CBS 962.96) TaxID=1314807 RepID=A0A4S8MZV9_DENBC|nr:hypothetical protein K435DRAFT_641339 [Dendrothele bispora CBS 962.96]
MTDDEETYLLLLLSDSNLPTGSFVASSGLESYITHAFGSRDAYERTVSFMHDSLASYTRSALPFVSDAHQLVSHYRNNLTNHDRSNTLSILRSLDDLYETMTLNHVARRASKSQGVALLSLYSKGFSRKPTSTSTSVDADDDEVVARISDLVTQFKLCVRKEATHGHLPICWGILTAALGLSLERSQYLHIFLQARSLLSASVRLNEIGPYGAQQILLHSARPLIISQLDKCKELRTGVLDGDNPADETANGPANTWPLGELLAIRHDLLHSRIFNS